MANSFRRNSEFKNKEIWLFALEKQKTRLPWRPGRLDRVSFMFTGSLSPTHHLKRLTEAVAK